MDFYQSITDHYHHIFPLNKMQVEFVLKSIHDTQNKKLLDIGCGIGELSYELSKSFKSVDAIDLDESMIKRAKKEFNVNTESLLFKNLNMLNIESEFGENSIDSIVCFGNTLVHLDGPSSILKFFKQAKSILTENGKLLFQIINYDRIIDQNIDYLPTIENDHIKFQRIYEYAASSNKITFKTLLQIKETEELIKNDVQLYPLRKAEIEILLKTAGFTNIQYFSNFNKMPYTVDCVPLIVEVEK